MVLNHKRNSVTITIIYIRQLKVGTVYWACSIKRTFLRKQLDYRKNVHLRPFRRSIGSIKKRRGGDKRREILLFIIYTLFGESRILCTTHLYA